MPTVHYLIGIRATVPDFIGGDKNLTLRINEYKQTFRERNKNYKGELPDVVWEHPVEGQPHSRAAMRELLASADAFVLASRGEGWGLPVAEAMSMTLPVIVPNHTGKHVHV